jgi:hypothetical protein
VSKRALLVGIDEYDNVGNLFGCVNDVAAAEPLLARNENGSPNFVCRMRTSRTGGVERDALLAELDTLLGGGADVSLLYFAGHGQGSGNDVALVTKDATQGTPGIALSEIMAHVVGSRVPEVILVLDCCFAGAAGGVPQLGIADASLRNGVSILAASRGDQTSSETSAGRGIFSTYVCGGLEGGAADVLGKVSVAGLYSYLDESFGPWDQRPVFKANIDRLHELRLCRPAVPIEELRLLPQIFPDADHDLPLDISYEPEEEPHVPEHEAVFSILQKCRAAKLVIPVGEEHLYWAAMYSKACRLTPLGQHYWHLASQRRL